MKARLPLGVLAALAASAIALLSAGPAAAAPPGNDNFSARQVIGPGLPIDVDGTTVDATAETGEPDHGGIGDGPSTSIWYEWQPTSTQAVRLDACDSSPFPLIAVYTGTAVNGLTLVEDSLNEGCAFAFTANSGTNYKIAIETFGTTGGEEGPTNLQITALVPPPNDAFASAVTLPSAPPISVDGTTVDASRQAGEPDDPNDSAGSVWYAWTAGTSQQVSFDTCTSDLDSDPTLTVYTGDALNALTLVTSNDDGFSPDCSPNDLGSRVTVNAVAGTTYRIAVAALCGSAFCEGAFTLKGTAIGGTTPGGTAPVVPATPAKKCKKGQKAKNGKCVKKKKKKGKKKK